MKEWLRQLFTRQEQKALFFLLGISFLGLILLGFQRGRPSFASNPVRLEVHVNTASAAELAALPGIGPKVAERIVEDRAGQGRFLTLTDLSRVKGITPKTLAKMKGLVRFD